ncbi:MAG: hydrogenase maturation nickel metallochaperone HypA [Armatimonadota bacterium]|nr:hydrogenase maturation nickel metallochaperone HypA [Armatimonadota bacterium]
MHELGITQNVLSIVLKEATKAGASRVTKVSLKVGEWSTVEPDCLKFYFGILAKGTLAEGAEVAVEQVPVAYACENCGHEYIPLVSAFACPRCSSNKGKLITGRELFVDSIEVENADSGSAKSSGCK